ncbi:pirin-like C-terminal cupin domain-containing protein [endosymbiont 'TC1' of Trimyema compressum]|uniref:pirin-like C-terminal cupin domain-containing protein n=1 Tax=endosymbiont 'TC1' of Trimyema compressum TaxID=243899 RepID=UPI003CCB8540
MFEGNGYFEENNEGYIENKRAVLFNPGDYIEIKAGNEGMRFILLEGKPLNEPIAWGTYCNEY